MEWNEEKVELDPEEETMRSSPRRFWELLKAEGAGLLLVNVVFVLTCVPLVTIPAAILALNREVRESLDDKPVKVRGYLAKLRKNWGTAWGAFLLTALPLVGAGYGARFYLSFAARNWVFFLPFMLCTTVFIVTLL